jgi:hypothetical protein
MRRVLILSVLLIAAGAAAQSGYLHELKGAVNDPDFNFDYASDWRQHQIVNFVRNDHNKPLVVFWLAGGIIRPVENPLAPHKTEQNSSPCPENRLDANLNATLSYGLSDHTASAGVYRIAPPRNAQASLQSEPQTGENVPEQMVSEIVTDIKGEPVRFQVVSERSSESVAYYFVFVQGKPTYFAMNVPRELFKYFDDAKVSVQPDVAESLKYEPFLLLKQVANFKAYSVFKPMGPKSLVKIPAKSVQIRRQLLFLVDQDMHILASGYVTLHVPA